MVGKGGNDGENADFFQHLRIVTIPIIFTVHKIEKGVLIIIYIVDAHLEDTLPFTAFMRHDELRADVEVMERLHTEIVLLAVILHITYIMSVAIVKSCVRVGIEIVLQELRNVLLLIDGDGQRDRIAGSEDPRHREVDFLGGTVHQHDGDIVAAVVAGEEHAAEVEVVELLLRP